MNAIYNGVITSIKKLLAQTKDRAENSYDEKEYYDNVAVYLNMLIECIEEDKSRESMSFFYKHYTPKNPDSVFKDPFKDPLRTTITCDADKNTPYPTCDTNKYVDSITGR